MKEIKKFHAWFSSKEIYVDFLINNAGTSWGSSFEDYPESGWDKVMSVNSRSVFFISQIFLDLLKKSTSTASPSRIINIGSIDGLKVSDIENYAYGASKASVHHLTKMLAMKLCHEPILVNAITPGLFPSDMLGSAVNHDYEGIANSVPLKRIGSTSDIAGACLFLSSAASNYVTGQVLVCDGGISSR